MRVSCLWALAGVAVAGSQAMPSVSFIQGAWQEDTGPAPTFGPGVTPHQPPPNARPPSVDDIINLFYVRADKPTSALHAGPDPESYQPNAGNAQDLGMTTAKLVGDMNFLRIAASIGQAVVVDDFNRNEYSLQGRSEDHLLADVRVKVAA